ncbi:MAG: Na+/H+ antiporter subunit E [Verrucomicrobiae bacterium]|nr:Na+/H+ antiporter subunit E [Verrucomicrobiae bacterium]NNJ86006.1 Na+/H+ antiporter subunit E [Akkermansiaceae bacterium]
MKHLIIFPFFYLMEIALGALRIAGDVLAPKPKLQPVMLRVPVDLKTDMQRLLLANLISMTPGTLSVGEEKNGSILLVHSLYGGADPEQEIQHIKSKYETVVARLPI